MGFFKTLITGYKLMYRDINTKHIDLIPRCFTGCGTGLLLIGNAISAKTAMQEDVRQVVAEANAMVDEVKNSVANEKKSVKVKKIFKAKAIRGWKIVKAFRKSAIINAVGVGCVGAGYGMAEHEKHKAIKAVGTLGAIFAGYRANVRDDLGEEADLRYLTGRKAVKRTEKVDKKTGEVTQELEYVNDDGVVIKKDPNAFRFWFSKETCPSLWMDNYDLRKENLKWVEQNLSRMYMATWTNGGALTLNDMRREFGGLTPRTMDVDIGGIFGRMYDPDNPETHKLIDLHFRDDKDFMEGRTDSCWIIFDCDPEPIIGRMRKKKFTQVEG